MGPDGRLMKLDNLQTALRFVQLHLGGKPHPDYPGVYKETYRMEELVSTYKRSLRKKKKMKKNEERLAQLSKTPLELSEISHIVDCQPMLDDLHDLVRVTEVTGELDEEQLGRTTTIPAALLLYKVTAVSGREPFVMPRSMSTRELAWCLEKGQEGRMSTSPLCVSTRQE